MSVVVAVVGPTAVGKSRLGIELARTLNGEIISADSRQVYRYMDIGTAKPTLEERSAVPHHLIDIVNPDEDFSVAVYQSLAVEAIGQVMQRGRLPVIVGGSGLYVWSLVEGWQIPRVEPDTGFRRRLEERAAAEGGGALYRELQRIDPESADSIDPRNVRRVIRALEVHRSGGTAGAELRGKNPPQFQTLIVGLTAGRQSLYQMIDRRVDRMVKLGLVQEVKALMARGYGSDLASMSSVGYKEISQYIGGRMDLAAAIQKIKFGTHRFARHQYAWFHLDDPRIHWFDVDDRPEAEIMRTIASAVK